MESLSMGCRVLLATVFAVAAWSKLRSRDDRRDFVASLASLPAAPAWFARLPGSSRPGRRGVPAPVALVGVAVPAAEVLAAVLLVPGRSSVPGLALAAALLVAFTAVIAVVLGGGRAVTCRCFGAGGARFGRRHLARNAVLLAAAAVALPGAGGAAAAPTVGRVLVPVVFGLLAALVVIRLDDMVYLAFGRQPQEQP